MVSEDGVKTDPEKLDALKKWPIPKDVKDVRAFLGFTGYYRRFIRNYASIARPLNDLLIGHCTNTKGKRKSKTNPSDFIWTEHQQEAFDTLIQQLTNPPILAYADYKLPFKLNTDASLSGLGAVLYQNQGGVDRVVAYASRSLKVSERNYPAHKLEFLALKWSITEKFHDYLYGATFEVLTDNNPLTYVFTTAKLDATGQRWLAELTNYNFNITYRSGKHNADADGLSRLHEQIEEVTLFPDVLKAVYQSSMMTPEEKPLVETLTNESIGDHPTDIPDPVINSTSLKKQDWRKAQSKDPNIRFVVDCLIEGYKPSHQDAIKRQLDKRYMYEWQSYILREGVLYRRSQFNTGTVDRLCLPQSLSQDIFQSYHDDLGHQGRDRTMSLIKSRFFWPGMDKDISGWIRTCDRCIRRKKPITKAAELVNIQSSAPMELVCVDYLKIEPSKGGYENVLVITDHYTRYAQAIPTRNQSAATTARVLFENYFVHYGFPGKLHSDQGANFTSKIIQQLCKLTGTAKTRTTPYHPMGNGMCERFNKTLLNMLGTLQEKEKCDWKSHLPALTHAYNAAEHASTGYPPFYLMYGRQPRLAIDALLGIGDGALEEKVPSNYVTKLKTRLNTAYEAAAREAAINTDKHKQLYDRKVRNSVLEPGDRVLVEKVGLKGRQKLADLWENHTYIVKRQIAPDIPVYEVQQEGSNKKARTLHRNMLLPFEGLPVFAEPDPPKQHKAKEPALESSDDPGDSSVSSSEEAENCRETWPKYIPPHQRRRQQNKTSAMGDKESRQECESSADSEDSRPRRRRGKRIRYTPERYQAPDWRAVNNTHIIHVNPKDIIYL